MNIIHLTPSSHTILNQWLDNNVELAHICSNNNLKFLKNFVLSFASEDGKQEYFRCFCKHKNKNIKISVKEDGKQEIKLTVIYTPDSGSSDYLIKYDAAYTNTEQLQNTVQMIASDCLAIIALFIFGNVVESKTTSIVGKSDEHDKHYYVKELNGNAYAVNTHSHRSPEGVFSVRGHFRRYKNGKIVWIESYLKGTEKNE